MKALLWACPFLVAMGCAPLTPAQQTEVAQACATGNAAVVAVSATGDVPAKAASDVATAVALGNAACDIALAPPVSASAPAAK